MKPGRRSIFKPEASVVDAALGAMDAEALRELIRGVLPWLDDKLHAKITGEIIDRAARNKNEWVPDAPGDESVAEVLEFAEAAQRVGYADPSEVDDYLRQGMNAFLAKDYCAALQIFRALIVPLSEGEIDLGLPQEGTCSTRIPLRFGRGYGVGSQTAHQCARPGLVL